MASDTPAKEPPSATAPADIEPLAPHVLPAGIAWAVVVAIGGGWITGVLVAWHFPLGFLGLMAVGVLGGVVSRRISRRAIPLLGWALVLAVFLALILAQIYLVRYRFKDVETWSQAIEAWPALITSRHYGLANLVALMCAGLGAHSAYWRAGKRFRRVMDE
jgi:MFS family permease